ncbi:hypothetical protein [Pseudogemmobacter blasticus]|uniref:UDP-glucose 4-epimerase n=1 Tax=Fuscovulum blasticum DSM 2131 TaxID=1188250 RepID=A0A2T4JBQ5_FUSBL|nr:hypothetical protein [Fuscovulum blasticum]PTE15350.1 hypothetical protein C5F44_05990 [Fuscovulum blasticum DSM 2131]
MCVLAAESGKIKVYNGGSGQGVSLREIIAAIENAIGKPLNPAFKVARPLDVPRSVLDMRKAKADLDWSPETGLESGMHQTFDWFNSL